jgi:hypothetical protein
LTALTFSLSECFDFFISFGFWCYKNIIFCPLFNRPIFGEGYTSTYLNFFLQDILLIGVLGNTNYFYINETVKPQKINE